MPSIEKLPKWAQEHINDLESSVKCLGTALECILNNQKESPIYSETYTRNGDGHKYQKNYIQDHKIYCQVGNLKVDLVAQKDKVQIYFSMSKGFGEAYILPVASNSIEIIGIDTK
jgi:hypothetical protein